MVQTNEEILRKLASHKEAMTTVRSWDRYASIHNLPRSITLIKRFGSWNKFKDALGLSNKRQRDRFSKDELIRIGKENVNHFSTKRQWEAYAAEHHLPSPQTYINVFGTWNDTRIALGLPPSSKVRKKVYSKEAIINLLNDHYEQLTSRENWDNFAKENDVPSYSTISKYLSLEEIREIRNRTKL